jgi:hypothetical protein
VLCDFSAELLSDFANHCYFVELNEDLQPMSLFTTTSKLTKPTSLFVYAHLSLPCAFKVTSGATDSEQAIKQLEERVKVSHRSCEISL